MSWDAVERFVARLSNDKGFAARFEAALDGRQGDGAAEAFAAFAREAGFDVEAEDVAALRGAREGELTDGQLDGVAGGNSGRGFQWAW